MLMCCTFSQWRVCRPTPVPIPAPSRIGIRIRFRFQRELSHSCLLLILFMMSHLHIYNFNLYSWIHSKQASGKCEIFHGLSRGWQCLIQTVCRLISVYSIHISLRRVGIETDLWFWIGWGILWLYRLCTRNIIILQNMNKNIKDSHTVKYKINL